MDDNGSAAAALAIIREWEWEYEDFDGFGTTPKWLSLNEAMNSLAFAGHADPARAFLRLLADGALVTRGKYQWRAFRAGNHFDGEGSGGIPPARWLVIVDSTPFDMFDLPKLGLSNMEPGDWDWRNGCCTVAAASDGDPAKWWETGYAEEWFSAWDIEVHCPSVDFPKSDSAPAVENDACEPAEPLVPIIGHSKGRPPKYDWEGALAYVTAVANTPDGLETGPGAQAAIERLMADHFTRTSNDGSGPCESEIRKRASRVMKAIEALKPSLSKVA